MSEPAFAPKDIAVENDDQRVRVTWKDGHESLIPVRRVRGYCPCAECQGHGGDLAYIENACDGIEGAEMVGRYAILFRFADGHDTGIFRFEFLRRLDPAEEARWGKPETRPHGG